MHWPKSLKRPAMLRPGDRVAIVTPSWGGPATFPDRFAAGIRFLEDYFGINAVPSPHALKPADWLDRNPKARAEDVMWAFEDPSISAVIASIGGDDAIRLLPYLDLSVIANNPKIFMGYSDATVLHLACLKAGIASFYGPTVMAGFAENGGMHDFTISAVRRMLFSSEPPGSLPTNTRGWTAERLDWSVPGNQFRKRRFQRSPPPKVWQGSGYARGSLIGGCAETLEMVKGTALWPPLDCWTGKVLFYETSEEAPAPSVVSRWLRNFGAQGILGEIVGVLVGRPGGGVLPEHHDAYGAAIAKVMAEYGAHRMPLITGLDFGHTDPMTVLPYGITAEIDCETASIAIFGAAVIDTQPFGGDISI